MKTSRGGSIGWLFSGNFPFERSPRDGKGKKVDKSNPVRHDCCLPVRTPTPLFDPLFDPTPLIDLVATSPLRLPLMATRVPDGPSTTSPPTGSSPCVGRDRCTCPLYGDNLPRRSMTDAEQRVAELIRKAFQGVTLGNSVGLRQGQWRRAPAGAMAR